MSLYPDNTYTTTVRRYYILSCFRRYHLDVDLPQEGRGKSRFHGAPRGVGARVQPVHREYAGGDWGLEWGLVLVEKYTRECF